MRIKSLSRPLSIAVILISLLAALLPPLARMQERGISAINIRLEDGKEVRLYDKSYALVIGVSDYTTGWPKLPGVKKDVESVARALELHGFQVTVVMNPSSAQLDKSYRAFIDEHGAGVENRLLFYFAGHGHTEKQSYGGEMGYVVPADAPRPDRDPAGFRSKAMDMQQIEVYARRIQSKHALFLFDSCFSGSIFALSRAVPDSISYKTSRPVRQFITSGSADELVPDKSVFREQFVEAIMGEADGNKDSYVTGGELGEFLQDKVVNYSRNAQHPQYGKLRDPNLDKGDFVFALPKAMKASPIAANVTPTPEQKVEQKQAGNVCALAVSESSVAMAVGGSATLAVRLDNYAGPTPPRLNVSTPHWVDIIILAEPRTEADGAYTSRFTVTSTSKKTGDFIVIFASPCGRQEVAVNVR